jgi:hypothetical protein
MDIIGKKVLLAYSDQNEDYGQLLPRIGTIEKRLASDNVDNWFLFNLDEPFNYNGTTNTKLLIRSRWQGIEIGNEDNVSVFIVQIPDNSVIKGNTVNILQENLMAWGTANVI